MEGSDKPPIDIFVLDPNKKIVYSRRGKNEGVFELAANVVGTYSFVFSNRKSSYKGDKSLTFALHTSGKDGSSGPSTFDFTLEDESLAEFDEITTLRKALDENNLEVNQVLMEFKWSAIRQNEQNKYLDQSISHTYYTTIGETILFVVVAFAQVYYLKNVLTKKRLV
eukprot:CAMPEP_0170542232 /NCGR_PEP_ID=MMETSP0211-20121228/1723_1 /TAXON_ID=311385 /ORGANISM="Pseudokeronopsis sp., Strain OXSARD2" /LENGTH=166 /DNA_ID=CAMNT_0010845227 /DNA_START=312 /DNA_END=812 /DNA_ORIENTATION=+